METLDTRHVRRGDGALIDTPGPGLGSWAGILSGDDAAYWRPGTRHQAHLCSWTQVGGVQENWCLNVVPVSRLQLLNNRLQMMAVKCLRDYKVVPRLQLAVAVIRCLKVVRAGMLTVSSLLSLVITAAARWRDSRLARKCDHKKHKLLTGCPGKWHSKVMLSSNIPSIFTFMYIQDNKYFNLKPLQLDPNGRSSPIWLLFSS